MIAQQQLEYKAVHDHLTETQSMLSLTQESTIITIKKVHLYYMQFKSFKINNVSLIRQAVNDKGIVLRIRGVFS